MLHSGQELDTFTDENGWEFKKSDCNQYLYKCENNNLSRSAVVIIQEDNQRLVGTIYVQSIEPEIHKPLRDKEKVSKFTNFIFSEKLTMYHFQFWKNDATSVQFMNCIELINNISPMSEQMRKKLLSHAQGDCLIIKPFFNNHPKINSNGENSYPAEQAASITTPTKK